MEIWRRKIVSTQMPLAKFRIGSSTCLPVRLSQNGGGVDFFGGPKNKNHTFLGSILGSPSFGKLPYRTCQVNGSVCYLARNT